MNRDSARSDRAAALPAHLPALDGLRGIAILLVLGHMLSLLDAPPDLVGKSLSFVFATGWIGVQLFFVLSGFLITGILLDTQSASNYFTGFFARRTLRIFPLYYATLLVAFVVLPALGRVPPALQHDRSHQVWLWTYLSNWVNPYEAGSRALPHFWSLGVEEQFYLVWPFVLYQRSPARCVQICVGVALTSLVVRLAMLGGGASHGALYTFSVTRMDALALGAAAGAALRMPGPAARLTALRGRLWLASLATGLVGALLTHAYSLETFAGASFGYTFLSVTFALAVLAAACSDTPPATASALRARPLRTVGKYSYAMYVLHKPLHDFVGKPVLKRFGLDASHSTLVAIVYIACGIVLTFVAAYGSYHLFERHFLRWKGSFAPRLRAPDLIE